MQSGQYSGLAIISNANNYTRPDLLGTTRTRYNALPSQAKTDLQAFRDVYLRYQPPRLAARLQARVYDSYLRTQGVTAGVADYGRVIDLLVAARRSGLLSFDGRAFLVKP